MSSPTDFSSPSTVSSAISGLNLELKLQEALRENETCLSSDLQKKLKDVSDAKSYSLLPKDIAVEKQNPHEDMEESSADIDCIPMRLRFLSHVFLDSELKGSKLEGFSFKQLIDLVREQIAKIKMPSEIDEQLFEAMDQIKTIDELIIKDVSLPRDEVIHHIKELVLNKSACSKSFTPQQRQILTDLLSSTQFKSKMEELLPEEDIFSGFIQRYSASILRALPKISEEILLKQQGICNGDKKESKEEISQLINLMKSSYLRSIDSCVARFYEISKEKNADTVNYIKNSLLELKPHKKLCIPSGFVQIDGGHAMVLIFEKNEDQTVNISIVNTGDGTQYHASISNVLVTSQGKSICSIPRKEVISALLTFYHVPLEEILAERNTCYPFLQYIVDCCTLPFQFYFFHKFKDPALLYYEMISTYLTAYQQPICEDKDKTLLINPQESGTCTWSAFKALIRLAIPTKESYYLFSHQLKTNLLKDNFIELATGHALQPHQRRTIAQIIYRCAKYHLTSLEEKITSNLQIEETEKIAIATAADISDRISTYLENGVKTLINTQAIRQDTKNHLVQVSDSDLALLEELSKASNIEHPENARKTENGIAHTLQIPSPLVHFTTFQNIGADFIALNNIQNCPPLLRHVYFEEYIDSINFSAEDESKIEQPELLLRQLLDIVNDINKPKIPKEINRKIDTAELNFSRNWKAFLLGMLLVKQIDAELLCRYPLDCFNFLTDNPLLHFLIASHKTQNNIQSCLEVIKRHNERAEKDFDYPLFHNITNVSLELNESCNATIKKDSTILLYQYLIENYPKLHLCLSEKFFSKSDEKTLLADPTTIELSLALYEDFSIDEGILKQSGLGYITILKNLFFYAYNSLKSPHSIHIVQTFYAKIDKKSEHLTYTNTSSINRNECPVFFAHNENNEDIIRGILAAHRKELTIEEKRLSWSDLSLEEKESYFLKNANYFTSAFKSLKGNKRNISLIKDLFLIAQDDLLCFDRLITILSRAENEECLNNSLLFSLCQTHLLSTSPLHPQGNALVEMLRQSESLRQNTADFILLELGRYARKEHNNIIRLSFFLELALQIKKQLHPIPFLADFKDHLILSNAECSSSISCALLDHEILFESDLADEADLLDILIARLHTHVLSDEQRLFFAKYLPKISKALVVHGVDNKIKQACIAHCNLRDKASEIQDIYYDADHYTLWLCLREKKIGIDLACHRNFVKTNQGHSQLDARQFKSYITEHPFFQDLKRNCIDVYGVEDDAKMTIETMLGCFLFSSSDVDEDDYSFAETSITYTPSNSACNKLPEKYKEAVWEFITNSLCSLSDDIFSTSDRDDNDDTKKHIKLDDIHETKLHEIFKCLPFYTHEILYTFACKYKGYYAVLCMNASLMPTYLLEIEINTKDIFIYELINKKVLRPLDHNSAIRKMMPNLHCYYENANDQEHIFISDDQEISARIKEEDGHLKIVDNHSYTFVGTESSLFPFAKQIMLFQSDKDLNEYYVLTSNMTPIITTGIIPKVEQMLMKPHLFSYKIQKGKIVPLSLRDELYLCILKIQIESADRFHQIDKIRSYIDHTQSEDIKGLACEIIQVTLSNYLLAGRAKDEFCLFIMHLAAFLIQKESATFDDEIFFELYTYYKTKGRIPDRHLIPIHLEKIILSHFSQGKEKKMAEEWEKYYDHFQQDTPNSKHVPHFKEGPAISLPSIPSLTSGRHTTQVSTAPHSLYASVSIAEIAACIQNDDKQKLKGCFFDLLLELKYMRQTTDPSVLVKICLCLNKDLLTTLQVDPSLDEESQIHALMQEKNRKYLNEILHSWKGKKRRSFTDRTKISCYQHQHLLEPIVLEKIERSIAFLYFNNTEAQCQWYKLKKSLTLSRLHSLSQKISEITKKILNMAQERSIADRSEHKITNSLQDSFHDHSLAKGLSILRKKQQVTPALIHETEVSIEKIDMQETSHHYHVFFSSLDRIIASREENLLQFIHLLQQSDNEQINPFISLAGMHSKAFSYNTFDTLLCCFADAFPASYSKEILPLKYTAIKRLHIPPQYAMAIHEEISTLLLLKIWQRKLAPVEQAVKNGMIPLSKEIWMDFSEKNVHWLLFEYITGLDLREKQRDLLSKLEECKDGLLQNHVAQLMMGEGKTSVIIPLLSFSASDNEKISLVICLKAQLQTMVRALTLSQKDLFSQKVISIDLDRKDISEDSLEELWENISSAKEKKYVFIAAAETIQSLELEFVHMILQEATNTESFSYLQKILFALKAYGNCIVDEFAHIADVSHVTNFPLLHGDNGIKRVPLEQIDIMRELFTFLLSRKDAPFQKIKDNEQIYLTKEELCYIDAELKVFIKTYFLEKHPSLFDEAFIDSMLSQRKVGSVIAEALRKHPSKEACRQLALTHLCLNAILPKVLSQCGGRNYGRSVDADTAGKIIPYQGVGSPATTEFGFAFEAIAYHFMYAAQFGLDAKQITSIAKRLRKEGMIKAKAQMIKLDQTEQSLLFYSLTGITLSESEKQEGIDAAVQKLENDRRIGDVSSILQLEALSAYEYVVCFERYLSSTPHNLFSQFKTVRGLTGTPWNHPTYGRAFSGHIHLDTSTEEKITQAYLSKSCVRGIDSYAFVTKEKEASALLASIYDKVHADDKANIAAIVDTGGLFKEHTNQAIAEQILITLEERRSQGAKKISVLYYSSNEDTLLPDIPHILQWDSASKTTETFVVSDFTARTLNSFDVLNNPYFVYYDERHSIGTDIVLPEKAIILITADSKTAFFQFSQGIMRARRFLLEQKAITIIPESMLEVHPHIAKSADQLLMLMRQNEQAKLSSQVLRSYKMQIEDVCRRLIVNMMLSPPPTKFKDTRYCIKLLQSFSEFFIKQEELCPIELIKDSCATLSATKELENMAREIIKRFQHFNCSERYMQMMMATFNQIISKAKNEPLLSQGLAYDDLFKEVFVENHVDQHSEQQLQQQIEQEMVQEINSLQSSYQNGLFKDDLLPWESIISHFQYIDMPFTDIARRISVKQMTYYDISPFKTPYHKAFSSIYLTNNAIGDSVNDLRRLFFKQKKQLVSLLVIKQNFYIDKQPPALIALTYAETKQLIDLMKTKQMQGVFLLNMQGQTMCDSYESLELAYMNQSIQDALVEMNVFNMTISELTKFSEATYRWLNPSKEQQELGAMRQRLLQLMCILSGQKKLLSTITTLKSGELLDHQDRKKAIASQIISKAQEALQRGDARLARRTLFHFPLEQLSIVPADMCHMLSKQYLTKLIDQGQIACLSTKDCIYLQKGQLKHITTEKIQNMMKDGRIDIKMKEVKRQEHIAHCLEQALTLEDIDRYLLPDSSSTAHMTVEKRTHRNAIDDEDTAASVKRSRRSSSSPIALTLEELERMLLSDSSTRAHMACEKRAHRNAIDDDDMTAHGKRPRMYDAASLRPILTEKKALIGFENLGNTCYINAALKALFHLQVFCERLYSVDHRDESLLANLTQLLSAYTSSSQEDIGQALEKIVLHEELVTKGFSPGAMHDADELCRLILRKMTLSEDLSFSIVHKGYGTSITSLYPPHEKISDIQTLITEQLSHQCSHPQPQMLSLLALHIARFNKDGMKNIAPMQNILQPVSLVLDGVDSKEGTVCITLDPTALICHRGETWVGHYTAITISDDRRYLLHNDLNVTEISFDQAKTIAESDCYEIFYKVRR